MRTSRHPASPLATVLVAIAVGVPLAGGPFAARVVAADPEAPNADDGAHGGGGRVRPLLRAHRGMDCLPRRLPRGRSDSDRREPRPDRERLARVVRPGGPPAGAPERDPARGRRPAIRVPGAGPRQPAAARPDPTGRLRTRRHGRVRRAGAGHGPGRRGGHGRPGCGGGRHGPLGDDHRCSCGRTRHVIIAPHDWSRIYLRRRWTEAWPSRAFEITSVSAGVTPVEVAPPTSIFH